MSEPTTVLELAIRQLAAYNRRDTDAFCACFHPEVTVLDADGTVALQGMTAFRERYGTMFATHREVTGTVSERFGKRAGVRLLPNPGSSTEPATN